MKNSSTHLSEDYEHQQNLFAAQPAMVQRFFEAQGKQLAEAVANGMRQFTFNLPDQVMVDSTSMPVPQSQRTYTVGSFFSRFRKVETYKELRHELNLLEQSPNRAVSVAGGLMRHATVMYMVHQMLPAGRAVTYKSEDANEAIPFIPEGEELELQSAITAETDAIIKETNEGGRGNLLVPFVPYARKFYLPQWVAFDQSGEMLTNTVDDAETHIKSMQRFMEILFIAVALAPYISADPEYVQKRYGMLGQLVNQARALAIYHTHGIIALIKKRAAARNLNRGLWLSVPYFDDQMLRLDMLEIEIIPAGRIVFLPAFVVRAVQQEQVKIAQDTRFNASTCRHILSLLSLLEQAFENA